MAATLFTANAGTTIVTATSDDAPQMVVKKAVDIILEGNTEVGIDRLPPRTGAMPHKYVLVSLNRIITENANSKVLFNVALCDIIIVSDDFDETVTLRQIIADNLYRYGINITTDEGDMECDDENYRAYRMRVAYRYKP